MSITDTTEKRYESDIEAAMLQGGYTTNTDAYDAKHALWIDTLVRFVRNTQPKSWQRFEMQSGTPEKFAQAFQNAVDMDGLLSVHALIRQSNAAAADIHLRVECARRQREVNGLDGIRLADLELRRLIREARPCGHVLQITRIRNTHREGRLTPARTGITQRIVDCARRGFRAVCRQVQRHVVDETLGQGFMARLAEQRRKVAGNDDRPARRRAIRRIDRTDPRHELIALIGNSGHGHFRRTALLAPELRAADNRFAVHGNCAADR